MTIIRDMDGLLFIESGYLKKRKVTMRLTSDDNGQTLGLADKEMGIMIIIPVEPVSDILEVKI